MTPSEIADRLEVNEPLPICPYDRRSPEYYTTNDTDPCKFCGTKNEVGAPDLCRGADTRLFAQAAATIRAQSEALKIATEALETAQRLLKAAGLSDRIGYAEIEAALARIDAANNTVA